MTIKEEIRDNVAILFLKGNMMGGPESMEVHEKLKKDMATYQSQLNNKNSH